MTTQIDTVMSVEDLGYSDEYVYDLCVPNNNMFFANDILVHNTDSIFLHLDPVLRSILGDEYDVTSDDEKIELVMSIIKRTAHFINKHAIIQFLDLHNSPSDSTFANKFNFKFKEELVIKRAIFLDTKKKYAIWTIQKENKRVDKLSVTGMEVVRSDYPRYTKIIMKDLLDKILKQNISKGKMLGIIDKYVEDYKKLLKEGSIDAGIPCVWNNKEYKVEPIAVRGMAVYNAIYGNVFNPNDKGYRFKLDRIFLNKLNDTQKNNLNKLKEQGIIKKEYDFIVIPEGEKLDTELFLIDIDEMVDYSIYNRIDRILELFNIDVKNTSDVGW